MLCILTHPIPSIPVNPAMHDPRMYVYIRGTYSTPHRQLVHSLRGDRHRGYIDGPVNSVPRFSFVTSDVTTYIHMPIALYTITSQQLQASTTTLKLFGPDHTTANLTLCTQRLRPHRVRLSRQVYSVCACVLDKFGERKQGRRRTKLGGIHSVTLQGFLWHL